MQTDPSHDIGAISGVTIATGKLEGTVSGGVARFLAIPYARAPVGEGRFMPPQAPGAWQGIRRHDSFAPVAPQLADPGFYPDDPDAMPERSMSEDCLYLNVWTPVTPGPHPVLVWLHGGSQLIGGTARPVYDGSVFARAGITCVTIGHRLGALGFLELGEHLGADYRDSGNSALRDQVAALEWVRDNIGCFGGDPGKVTLGGESAGAKNVAALMAAPSAKGLFHAAISISGGAETVSSRAQAVQVTQRIIDISGLSASALTDASTDRVLAWQETLLKSPGRKLPLRPVFGGDFLPRAPLEAIAGRQGPEIPLLVATSRDEALPTIQTLTGETPWQQEQLSHVSPETMSEAEKRFQAHDPDLAWQERRLRLLSAEEYGLPSMRLADAHSSAGHPAWMYRNDHALENGPFAGYAPHISDLDRIWGRRSSTDDLHVTICDFVKHGRVSWSQYHMADRRTAIFGAPVSTIDDPLGDMRGLFANIWHSTDSTLRTVAHQTRTGSLRP